ncbi:MAG TPA: phosphoenolpyruvate carboxykinase (ATP) [Gemmataceae bacterium]|nr:phosphoenolpyruvate carboxykinase (ATP) [Gemmataceae bacterium]
MEPAVTVVDLSIHGLKPTAQVYANLPAAALVEWALRRHEGELAARGAFVANTGKLTGRSPKDKYIVAEPGSKDAIGWGAVNQPLETAVFQRLHDKVRSYLQSRDLFVFDGWACADPRYRLPVRVIAEKAWHALFAHCLLLRPAPADLAGFVPELTIMNAADLHADPARDGTRSDVFIVLNLDRGQVLIGGTEYAGEIKKSVFSYLNYLMPKRNVFPMHCSANIGPDGDSALLFGLSGTGKTTLSADPLRRLIGDDEHGWSEHGVFNFEGGCYAKTIRLSPQGESQIYNAIRFGCVLENVVLDSDTRNPDYDSARFTENTRAAYPVDFIENAELTGCGGHPETILFLTCDAFGVLPPLSRLTPAQSLYHFLSGYTAKVAGTETGVTEPQATFSTCFAAPFLPLPPARYAEMLHDRLRRHRSEVWLVNTGWTGGSYGQGSRIKLAHTRALVRAAFQGNLAKAKFIPDPIFGVGIPEACPGVPPELLQPRNTWNNPAEYDKQAQQLAGLFQENFKKFSAAVAEDVRQAGPK